MQNSFIRVVSAIALGAIPGALIRYLITEFTKGLLGTDYSFYATFLINITGCFLIALFYTLSQRRWRHISAEIRLIFATGFCGSYTTFSTYGLETVALMNSGKDTVALLYWFGSMAIAILAVQLGVILGSLMVRSE